MPLKAAMRFPKGVGTNEVPSFISFRPVKAKFGTYSSLDDIKDSHGSSFASKGSTTYNVSQFAGGAGGVTGFLDQIKGPGGIIDNIANGALNSIKDIAGGALNITGDVNLFGGAINAKINIGDLFKGSSGATTNTTLNSGPSINLYMPPDLAMSLNANYVTSDLKPTTVAATAAADKLGAAKGFNGTTDAIMDSIYEALAAAATEFGSNGQLGLANQIVTGRVGNNYTFRTFNNMSHRSFSYNFRLIARNATDTKVIKDICDNFMEYMLPIKNQSDLYFYDIPYMWDIKYMHLGSENEYMDQPNMCFLENVGIRYGTDGGGHTYSSGAPIDVTLSLQFTEVEPLRRNKESVQRGLDIARNDPNNDGSFGD